MVGMRRGQCHPGTTRRVGRPPGVAGRQGRRRRAAATIASSILALSLVGCGASVEIGDVRIRLPGPDRGSPGGAPDRSPSDAAAAREAALDALVEQLSDGRGRLAKDVVLRLSLTGGWGLAERGDLHLSIEGDGRVVRGEQAAFVASRPRARRPVAMVPGLKYDPRTMTPRGICRAGPSSQAF